MDKKIDPINSHSEREELRRLVVRILFYSAMAVIIYFACKLFWWLGLVLFVIFAFYILTELIVTGSVFLIIALVLRLLFPSLTNYRVLGSKSFGDLQKSFGDLAASTIVIVLVQLYYLVLTALLGYFIFTGA